jgi:hypothetical protein
MGQTHLCKPDEPLLRRQENKSNQPIIFKKKNVHVAPSIQTFMGGKTLKFMFIYVKITEVYLQHAHVVVW